MPNGTPLFYVGLHQPSDAKHFDRCFISINRLRDRKSDFLVHEWIMDSGAFTEISTHGDYRTTVEEYALQIERWRTVGNMQAAVAQDWMCEPWIVKKTGKSVKEHQSLTIERYDALCKLTNAYVMPVLQGFEQTDYLQHLIDYGERLKTGAWVGVGSICKRNGYPAQIKDILLSIKRSRPDLRLHGFGIKKTALSSAAVCNMLYSADSMAWSFAARRAGRNANDWREAEQFVKEIAQRILLAENTISG